jgi:hypothetical protein
MHTPRYKPPQAGCLYAAEVDALTELYSVEDIGAALQDWQGAEDVIFDAYLGTVWVDGRYLQRDELERFMVWVNVSA